MPFLMRFALPVAAAVSLTACAVTGPSVTVYPGQGKPFEQFQADDGECRRIALAQNGDKDQRRYDMTFVQCMYAKGHRVPLAGQRPSTSEPPAPPSGGAPIPPPPQGTPPPPPGGPSR